MDIYPVGFETPSYIPLFAWDTNYCQVSEQLSLVDFPN